MDSTLEDVQIKIDSANRELSNMKSEFETYREALDIEIEDATERLKEAESKSTEASESLASARSEYNRSEIQIVSLQYTLETLKKTLKSYEARRCELEILNDSWEQSIRNLEFYNSSLESQLSSAEENVNKLTSKIHDVSAKSREEYKQIKAKCEEIKKVIQTSRSPSPVSKPPRSLPMGITSQNIVSIEQKITLEEQYKVVIVASKNMYGGETTVVFKDKNVKKLFEFNRVVTKESMTEEIDDAIEYINNGGNGCIINSSATGRLANLISIIKHLVTVAAGKRVDLSCIEIIKESTVNLLNTESVSIVLGLETIKIIEEALQKLSRGRSHILINFKLRNNILQLLDLGEVNDDQSLSESLSINASLFHLEELMMNLSKKANPNFKKSSITQNLEPSLKSNYFLLVMMHCETSSNLPSLTFAARLQAIFMRTNFVDEEIHRSLAMLEKERMSNFSILRLIEKVRKDMTLLKKSSAEKDHTIEILSKRIKNPKYSFDKADRIYSLSPTYIRDSTGTSRIPLPKSVKKN